MTGLFVLLILFGIWLVYAILWALFGHDENNP